MKDKCFHIRPLILLNACVAVFCAVALAISVTVWMDATDKSHTAAENSLDDIGLVSRVYKQPAGFNKVSELTIYFNGEKVNHVKACRSAGTGLYLPLDWFLQESGAAMRVYNPDDMIEATVQGKRVLIDYGEGGMLYDGKAIESKGGPVILGRHILVPVAFFKCIDGLFLEESEQLNGVFLDYRMPINRPAKESPPRQPDMEPSSV